MATDTASKSTKMLTEIVSNLIYVITWEARGCGAQYVGETSQSLKGRFRSHSFKIRTNSRRKYKNFLYDHFIKYNHSIENVTITPVEILSKQPGDSKNDMKKTQTFGRTQLDKATTDTVSSWL